ncbi:hypothetical protein [Alkaliphilus transvaalensis]|uniref:hypothetical protein n=1 Tax=Alkaliphilus transvaalensis TaxID=114628 RepID=UPI00047A2FB9|nr:hypothetical protein [Alkaliphilus transvaalensis]
MLKKVYKVLNPVIYSICDTIYLMPFYFVLLANMPINMNPSHFIIYAFVLHLLVSTFVSWCDAKKYPLRKRQLLIMAVAITLVVVCSLLMDSSNLPIIFLNFLFLSLNLSFLIRYLDLPSTFAFQFKKKVIRRLVIYLIFAFNSKFFIPEFIGFLDIALGYFMIYVGVSLILIGQYKISQVFIDQVEDRKKEENPLFEKYRVKKNLIINPEKSILLNFILQLTISLGLIGTVVFGMNIFYSPFHFVFSKTTNFVLDVLTKLLYYPLTLAYRAVEGVIFWAIRKAPKNPTTEGETAFYEGLIDSIFEVEKGEPGKIAQFIFSILHGLVYIALVFGVLYLVYRGIKKVRKEEEDIYQEKEFIYSSKDIFEGLSNAVKQVFNKFRNQEDIKNLHPIRRAYRDTIILMKNNGMKINYGDTPNKIYQKSKLNKYKDLEHNLSTDSSLATLTQEYNKVRYGKNEEERR